MVHSRPPFDPPKTRYLRAAFRGRHLAASPRLRWGVMALLLALYVIHFVSGDHGVLRRRELHKELGDVAVSNTRLRLEKERLLQEVQAKENDPLSLERLAREKYWMVGPGERVYRFDEGETALDLEDLPASAPPPATTTAPVPAATPGSPEPGTGVDGSPPR